MAFGASTPTPQLGEVETLVVTSRVVACDGDGGALGHPRVWLRIVEKQTFCPYCSRLYVLDPLAQESSDSGH
ncbi:zinc-finger domain-containing protein [Lichenicoccus sp.]|uniref:zinc-finger domain-containing protein n=1 Tax=Lichenicoccus sp. TaxID=2781899 RepID=UPI003D1206F5